jgi:hypothetical protein
VSKPGLNGKRSLTKPGAPRAGAIRPGVPLVLQTKNIMKPGVPLVLQTKNIMKNDWLLRLVPP